MRGLLCILLLASASPPADRDRSPSGLALSADGRWALTANATSDSASLVDLAEGRVAAEVEVGRRPFAAAWRGSRAVVTNWLSDSVSILDLAPPKAAVAATVPVGDEPRGVAISPDGRLAYVALSGDDAVAVVDLEARKVVARTPAGDEPWHLALTPDGKRLAVGNALSMTVTVIETATLAAVYSVPMRGHNLRHIAVSPDGAWAYLPNIAERGAGTTKENIDRGWVLATRLSRVPLAEEGPREAISLDPRGLAVGDADGLAVSPDGRAIAVAAGGTQELLILRFPLPFVAFGGPGDHIEGDLLRDPKRFKRVPLGGRPLGAAFTPDGRQIVVANYLANALQVLDAADGRILRTIALGGPAQPSLERRGEAIFYDAKRSFHEWYSCHSCHVDGHTNGATFDTLNDGRYGNPKKTLSLRGVAKTGPWTWHGWQKSLRDSLSHSLTTTLHATKPSAAELDELMAFLATLDFVPPSGTEDAAAVRRGQELFSAKSCDACHLPPDYTTDEVYLTGLEAAGDKYKGFNPPSLRGVRTRGPWLHDGRARSLEDLIRTHHRPSKLKGKDDPTEEELKDLVAFLKSL